LISEGEALEVGDGLSIGWHTMEFQGIEYSVVQGIERGVWKCSASVAGVIITGQELTKAAAVATAEIAIERTLAGKRLPRRRKRYD
jgi:hypothetical protein